MLLNARQQENDLIEGLRVCAGAREPFIGLTAKECGAIKRMAKWWPRSSAAVQVTVANMPQLIDRGSRHLIEWDDAEWIVKAYDQAQSETA